MAWGAVLIFFFFRHMEIHNIRPMGTGYSHQHLLEFDWVPKQCFQHIPKSRSAQKHQLMKKVIQHLLDIGVPQIYTVHREYTQVFSWSPKRTEMFWGILDLKWFNRRICTWKFKMGDPSLYFGSHTEGGIPGLHRSEVYLHVPVQQSHRKFLRCMYNKHFWYRAPPFELVFTQGVHKSVSNSDSTPEVTRNLIVSISCTAALQ